MRAASPKMFKPTIEIFTGSLPLPTHRPSYGIRRLGNKGYGFYVVAQGPKIVKSYRASRAESERRFTARLLARRIKT